MKIITSLLLLVPTVALAQTAPASKPAAPAAAPATTAPAATSAPAATTAPAASTAAKAPQPIERTAVIAPAKSEKGRLMVAPRIGLFEPTSRLSGAFFAGLEIGYVTPALSDHLALVLEVDWVRPRASGSVSSPLVVAGDGFYNLGNAEVGILLSAVYRFEDAIPRLSPYGGLGPGLFFHRTATQAFQNTYVETEGRAGFQMLGGADYTLGPGAAFGEVRYHFSRVNFLATGNANVGGFLALGVGYRLRF
jgi:hypothetical protein